MSESKLNISELLNSKRPKAGKTKFIAIDGHGGAGKSTLANMLSKQFNAQLVPIDDFASWDNSDWWPQVIKNIFEPISGGATSLNYPRSSWWEDHHPEPVVNQPVTDVMILEGVSSSRTEFRKYLSLIIFVNTPKDLCMKRGIERDLSTGKSVEELTEMWTKWYQEEDGYIARDHPRDFADVVIDGTRPYNEQIVTAT
ncbi:MAG TPA: hypothetical protein VMR34_01030 [Candidatus Saccharimonadales bacterium]|nr:hypothetical protein [Candidatus Saccharimonadales bacterium]